MPIDTANLQVVLITGMSGSGKSVVLHALEDTGFFCVDNLPPELLLPFMSLERQHNASRVAIAMDARNASALPLLPAQLARLKEEGVLVKTLFLDASTDTLMRRYSESRRKHPLSQPEARQSANEQRRALVDAIELERKLLADLRETAHIIDTSILRPSQLQGYIKSLISAPGQQLTLVFESFAFKRGVPRDADYVFDVRMLPNPHYEPELRHLTGQDAAVASFLQQQADVTRMISHIHNFLSQWLDALAHDHRSYVTVAIGCTGGQHRSVYLVEQLAQLFGSQWITLTRHRELGDLPATPGPEVS
jgi:RNase adapter protein RapZ